jgi:hypothetical protein
MIKEGHAMEDFFDDGFDEDEFMEDNLFEDFEEDLEIDDEPTEDESQDNGFSTKEAFILGGAMGWAYGAGRREKRKKLRDDSD